MNVLLFGMSGMVGQGVLRECLLDPDVKQVLSIGRNITGLQHPKVREIAHANMWNYDSIESDLAGIDACFFCLGVSSTGMSEAEYVRITHDITLAAATRLAKLNTQMTFIYVSGAGTDSTERGRVMWARVKGRTENDLLKLPFKAYMFRPGMIQPLHGIKSKTKAYRILYSLSKPLLPLLRAALPNQITTTEQMGRAMLGVAKRGCEKKVLESREIGNVR
ncbi:MAG TPA: epimerase [Rhodocyclaceae bacterium]|nr:epimerase [Rhodocyclaceae bacterium]